MSYIIHLISSVSILFKIKYLIKDREHSCEEHILGFTVRNQNIVACGIRSKYISLFLNLIVFTQLKKEPWLCLFEPSRLALRWSRPRWNLCSQNICPVLFQWYAFMQHTSRNLLAYQFSWSKKLIGTVQNKQGNICLPSEFSGVWLYPQKACKWQETYFMVLASQIFTVKGREALILSVLTRTAVRNLWLYSSIPVSLPFFLLTPIR